MGEGWHERAGERARGSRWRCAAAGRSAARGATAYVTLEPCSHHGRTPPCTEALIEAGVARVVYAIADPNPQVAGRGAHARAGRHRGRQGLLEAEAEELNAGFLKRMRKGTPFVRVKLGMSLDGRTALANGASQWITSEAARADVQRWRARSSAVLTGIGTVLADDPPLNVRLPEVATTAAARGAGCERCARRRRRRLFTRWRAGGRIHEGRAVARRGTAAAEGRTRRNPCRRRQARPVRRAAQARRARSERGAGGSRADAHGRLRARRAGGRAAHLCGAEAARPAGPAAVDLPLLEDLQQAKSFAILDSQQVGSDLRLRMRPV